MNAEGAADRLLGLGVVPPSMADAGSIDSWRRDLIADRIRELHCLRGEACYGPDWPLELAGNALREFWLTDAERYAVWSEYGLIADHDIRRRGMS